MPFLAPLAAAAGTAFAGTTLGAAATWLAGETLLAGLVRTGIAIAAQYAIGKIFQNKPPTMGVQLEITYGEKQPRSIIMGRCGVKGQHVFRNAAGSGNRVVSDIFRLADFNITAINRIQYEGEWRNLLDEHDNEGQEVSDVEAEFYVNVYYGTMTQEADEFLIDVANPDGRWTAAHKGIGVAYVIANQQLDRDKLQRPWECFVEVYGAPLYDWRKDSSVGGSGSHRWNDQSTWEFTENPVLMMYALERGIYRGSELIVGKGVPSSRLPLAEWTIAANICDENVSGKKRYTAGLIAMAGEGVTHDQNMQPLLEACAGSWLEDASGEFPIVGAVQAVVATFTDDDLMPGETYRFSKYRPRSELVNTVAGTYLDPESFYEPKQFTPRVDGAATIEDHERMAVSISYAAVNEPAVADRLSDIAIRASRYQANGEICLRPRFLQIKPGRWVEWQSARHGTRKFLVLTKRLGAIGAKNVRNVYVTLQEVGDGIFDPSAYVTVPTVPVIPGVPTYTTEPINFQAEAVNVTPGAGEEVIPGIRFTWNAYDDITVIGTNIEYRPTGQPDATKLQPVNVPTTVFVATDGVLSEQEYEYRRQIIVDPQRTVAWTNWETITTTKRTLPPLSVELAQVAAGFYAALQSFRGDIEELRNDIRTVAFNTTDVGSVLANRDTLAITRDGALAGVIQEQRVEIDEDLNALAEVTTALEASVGDTSAGILWRMRTQAGTGDVVSEVVLDVRASVGDVWVESATLWQAGFTGGNPLLPFSRFYVKASEFVVWDGSDESLPMVFSGGTLKLQNIIVDKLVIPYGELQAFLRPIVNQDYTALNPTSDNTIFYRILTDFDVTNESGNPMLMAISGHLTATQSGSGSLATGILVYNRTTNNFIDGRPVYVGGTSSNIDRWLEYLMFDVTAAQGLNNYELVQAVAEVGSTGTITFKFEDVNVTCQWGVR